MAFFVLQSDSFVVRQSYSAVFLLSNALIHLKPFKPCRCAIVPLCHHIIICTFAPGKINYGTDTWY
jgi:hypothetical protein